jgi:hypothetical protein
MTENELLRFEDGQRIGLRGNEYEVESVDKVWTEDKVIQYRLEAIDGPPAVLKPEPDGGVFVVQEFHEVQPNDVVVNNDG